MKLQPKSLFVSLFSPFLELSSIILIFLKAQIKHTNICINNNRSHLHINKQTQWSKYM